MSTLAGVTRGGNSWTPEFIENIDWTKCLGCGRCFKICGHDVLQLTPLNEDGEVIEDEEEEEEDRRIMMVVNPDNCIGCKACARQCAKKCITNAPLTV